MCTQKRYQDFQFTSCFLFDLVFGSPFPFNCDGEEEKNLQFNGYLTWRYGAAVTSYWLVIVFRGTFHYPCVYSLLCKGSSGLFTRDYLFCGVVIATIMRKIMVSVITFSQRAEQEQ